MAQTNNFWNLLVTSGLATSSSVAEIRTSCEGDLSDKESANTKVILKWLRDQKRISNYQMQVLAEGQPGPFKFEQYRVHALNSGGPLEGSFRARHVSSNHPVRLRFFGGKTAKDGQQWARIRTLASRMHLVQSPFVSRCYEIVQDGKYRFIAFEDLPGKSLMDKLPYKGRLPWPQALQAIELLALGLADVHENGMAHGRIWPGAVWLQRGGICQLLWQIPEIHYDSGQSPELEKVPLSFQSPIARSADEFDLESRQRHDLFSLGALAFRMIAGTAPKIKSTDAEKRTLEVDKHISYCEKHKLPDGVIQLFQLLLTADLNSNLKDARVTSKLVESLLETQSIKADVDEPLSTLADYQETVNQKNRSKGFLDTIENIQQNALPEYPRKELNALPDFDALDTSEPAVSVSERVSKRKSSKANRVPMIIGVSIVSAAAILGLVLSGIFSGPRDSSAQNDTSNPEPNELVDVETPLAEAPVIFRPQNLVEATADVPWESPTGAGPINVQLMPASPDFLVALRPKSLSEKPDGQKFISSLGAQFENLANNFYTSIDLTASQVERLTLSLHSDGAGKYHTVVSVELVEAIGESELAGRFGQSVVTTRPGTDLKTVSLGKQLVFFHSDDETTISEFAIGPASFVESSFESMGPAMAGRAVGQLLERSDRDRDVTILFRSTALLSQEGQWLFEGPAKELRRPLSLFLDDRMEAIMLSLHFDQGSYLEWMSSQSADLKDRELAELLPGKFSQLRDQLTDHMAQVPSHPHWAGIHQRFDNMLNDMTSQIRVGMEPEGIVANCWLPGVAPHNLITAGELVLNGADFSAAPMVANAGPKTLAELLATPRDLTVASDPDLINLLREIESGIKDDYPDLPFDFRIRLLGGDLSVDGITQNQRPGNFSVTAMSLSDILAQIMLKANPDKSATSPADAKCNLLWIVGPDPDEPSVEAILVTTRNAATKRNLPLPKVFQTNQ